MWNLLNDNNENQSNPWIMLANKAINGAFKNLLVLLELCQVMSDAAKRKTKKKGNQNIKYSEEFTNFLIILGIRYFSTLGCIVGSILLEEETCINIYSDIPNIITKIKLSNGIAKAVRIPLPRFLLVVITFIPDNGSDTVEDIKKLYRKLIEKIALQLQLHILSLGLNGAITGSRYNNQFLILKLLKS
ncbi:hypothetical protein C2G38_2204593 [Gigaspora rosea]|uniref:Uncharacterized protein n=1 Tax=Gigaspora rosea TaxID=44941 RepID=A0A397UP17_9GLOM|nr:hypothetical protein C2G38_2204593 [Gigaspora rosea]